MLLQSEDHGTEEASVIIEKKSATMAFLEGNTDYSVGFEASLPQEAYADATPDVSLSDFFKRPAKIFSSIWSESDPVGYLDTCDPWQLFFSQQAIANKLANYAWLKCDLKIKVMVNASPFYYGSVLMTYNPLPNFHPNSVTMDSGTRYFIPFSQRPHLWIYPQNNEGGEMTLPFVWQKNWLSTVSNQDFLDMGKLEFLNVYPLSSANGATGAGVSITVYAWAENVVVSGPTSGLLLQSDEYGEGAVSSIASAVATSMKALSKVPLIGKYATATSMGASAVASVASRMGFCNPPVISDVSPFKPVVMPPLASTEVSYPIEKLTIDPKNELSVDPTLVGLAPHDELSISHMLSRESYLTKFTWSSFDGTDTLLFSTAISPMMFDMDDLAQRKLYQTPTCFVGNMFQFWRGDMIIRLRFICSQYHRGRVRVVFDPSGNATQNILTTAVTQTTCFNEVIDLTKDTNVEIRVPYNQALAWCKTFIPTTVSQIPYTIGSGTTFNHTPGITNGTLAVRCVTALTAPVVDSEIGVLVSVRGAENLEFAAPQDIFPRYSYFAPQSEDYEITRSDQIIAGHAPSTEAPGRFLINHGENVVSLRQLLRRYSYSRSTAFYLNENNSTLKTYSEVFYRAPLAFGFDPTGIHSGASLITTGNFPINYVGNSYLTWISPCFLGVRGSINYIVNVDAPNAALKSIQVARQTGSPVGSYGTAVHSVTVGSNSVNANFYAFTSSMSYSSAGASLTNQLTNGALSFQAPMYSAYKFNVTTPRNATATISQDDSSSQALRLSVTADSIYLNPVKLHWYAAAGTDYSLVFFLNVPTVWVYSAIPTPA